MESDNLSVSSHSNAMVDSSESSFNNQLLSINIELQRQEPTAESSHRGSQLRNSVAAAPDINEIAMLLRCPVCYEIMLPPIISCSNGHNLCIECRGRVNSCPICRDIYYDGDGTFRNLLADQLASKCHILCKYADQGCKVILLGSEIRNHGYVCPYRPLACPDCEVFVEYKKFLQHVRDHDVEWVGQSHFNNCFEVTDDTTLGTQKWELTSLNCFNANFFCHTEKIDHCWIFWISCAEVNDRLKDYLCEIVLWHPEKVTEIMYKGPVNPIRTTASLVLSSGYGLMLPKDAIHPAVYNGGINVVFSIEKAQYQCPAAALVNASTLFHPELELVNTSEADAQGSVPTLTNIDLMNLPKQVPFVLEPEGVLEAYSHERRPGRTRYTGHLGRIGREMLEVGRGRGTRRR